VAEDPVTSGWVEVFASCSRFSRTALYAEASRYDACAVPKEATASVCTWITLLGHVCAVRGLAVSWMSDQQLYEYCTRPGTLRLARSAVQSKRTKKPPLSANCPFLGGIGPLSST